MATVPAPDYPHLPSGGMVAPGHGGLLDRGVLALGTAALFASFFVLRPMHLAWGYTEVGLVLLLGSGCLAFTRYIDLRAINLALIPAATFVIFRFYITAHAYYSGTEGTIALQGTLVITLALGGFVLAIGSPIIVARAVRLFVLFMVFQGYSWIVTALLTPALGYERLFMVQIQNGWWPIGGEVLIPLTLGYGWVDYNGLEMVRLGALFREAGIAQCFYVWALFAIGPLGLWRWPVVGGLVLGLIGTQSTVGFAVLAASLMAHSLLNAGNVTSAVLRGLAATVAAAVLLVVMYFAPEFGIEHKINAESGQDRLGAVAAGWQVFLTNPMGEGLYHSTFHDQAGINLISSLGIIGLPGVVLALLPFLMAVVSDPRPRLKLLLVLPFVVTWISAQSFLDAVLVFLFVSLPTPVLFAGRRPSQPAAPLPARSLPLSGQPSL